MATSNSAPPPSPQLSLFDVVQPEPPAVLPPAPQDVGPPLPPDPDASARSFAVDPGNNVVLEASAGTGKTSVLVSRYVNLLKRGVDPANILAITFTRKAAAEMRERILRELGEAAERSELDRSRWLDLRDRLGDIAISTIDAFCLSLLREFPLEADLDPGFDMADETEVPRLIEDALDHALRILTSHARTDAGCGPRIRSARHRADARGAGVAPRAAPGGMDRARAVPRQRPGRSRRRSECAGSLPIGFGPCSAPRLEAWRRFLADGPVAHQRYQLLVREIQRLPELGAGGKRGLPRCSRPDRGALPDRRRPPADRRRHPSLSRAALSDRGCGQASPRRRLRARPGHCRRRLCLQPRPQRRARARGEEDVRSGAGAVPAGSRRAIGPRLRRRARSSARALAADGRVLAEPVSSRGALSPRARRRVPGHQSRAVGARGAAHPVLGRGHRRDHEPLDLRGGGPQAVDLSVPRRRGRRAAGGGAAHSGASACGQPPALDHQKLPSVAGAARVRQRALRRDGRSGPGRRAFHLHGERPLSDHGHGQHDHGQHGHGYRPRTTDNTTTDNTDNTDNTDRDQGDAGLRLVSRRQTIRWCVRAGWPTRSRGFCARTACGIGRLACHGGRRPAISACFSGPARATASSSASSSAAGSRRMSTRGWASSTPTRRRMRWPSSAFSPIRCPTSGRPRFCGRA